MNNKKSLTKRLIKRFQISYEMADQIIDMAVEMGAEKLQITLNSIKATNFSINIKSK